jgi:putative DNA primase/helicase
MRTTGITVKTEGYQMDSVKSLEGTNVNLIVIKPNEDEIQIVNEQDLKRPQYTVHEKTFVLSDQHYEPGLYWHGMKNSDIMMDIRICSPIYVEAATSDEHDKSHGYILKFKNLNGNWHTWVMPKFLLKSNGEEIRGILLDHGIYLNPTAHKYLNDWLSIQKPILRKICSTRTGWQTNNEAFVLPNITIGNQKYVYQSENLFNIPYHQQGTVEDWVANIGKECSNNPILLLSLAAAFAAPLLLPVKKQNLGGIIFHLIGKSSQGKTTALQVAASIWGSPDYIRTWRATSNGLEAIVSILNDGLLILDEIGQCDSKEIGGIVYTLANGQGKQRASKHGYARKAFSWRTIVLSSGEKTLETHMSESKSRINAGQEARMLNIPATDRKFGAFDDIHHCKDGQEFSDSLKQKTSKYYGTVGKAFLNNLLSEERNLIELYHNILNHDGFRVTDGVEHRAAGMFALVAMAGELASYYGLTGLNKGAVLNACIELFKEWKCYRGEGETESRQIQKHIRSFIDTHGDSRFTNLSDGPINTPNRAGYIKEYPQGVAYLFLPSALELAAPGFSQKVISKTLYEAGWILENDNDRFTKKVHMGKKYGNKNFYVILPKEE